jgi:hypothetical protein
MVSSMALRAGAQLDDAFLGEGDDGVLGVIVLLREQ